MGMIIPDIGIAEAGGLQEYIIGAFGEFLQQRTGRFILIVINEVEIQLNTFKLQAQQ
ncbi:hypothetical protein D3C75_1291910 [compost metagenome]